MATVARLASGLAARVLSSPSLSSSSTNRPRHRPENSGIPHGVAQDALRRRMRSSFLHEIAEAALNVA